jgi:ferredoxin--NADP+ reductase
MAKQWVEGRVVGMTAWTEQLFSLQVDADIEPFEAGQFTKLGLEVGGEVFGRPYSLVSAPDERPLDFAFSIVADGPLSPRLASLEPGDRVLVAPRPAGFLVVGELPSASHLWLLATGTGIGPFLSMLRTETPWQRFERVVLVQAARYARELIYAGTIEALVERHAGQLAYVPFVSREPSDFALGGRIQQAIADGRLEARAGLPLAAETSQVMLCGNPQMVDEVTATLLARGLRRHRRREPGHISVETYW